MKSLNDAAVSGRKRRPPSPITLADRARDAGEWEEAARLYRQVLERNPKNAPIWVQYGHVLKESGRLPQAEAAYRRALEGEDAGADTHLQLGHVLKLQGRPEAASAAYLRALARDPDCGDARRELAALGGGEVSLSAVEETLRAGAGNPASSCGRPTRITLADRARDVGQWELAARLYREALERNPKNPPIWVQYGHALKESGELSEAESAYRTAIAYDPAEADSYLQLAHVLNLSGKMEEAEKSYLRSFAIDPSPGVEELRSFGWSPIELTALQEILKKDAIARPEDQYRSEIPTQISAEPQAQSAFGSTDCAPSISVVPEAHPTNPAALVRSNDAKVILASGLFDENWYKLNNHDAAASGIEPLTHYLSIGSAQGRCPNRLFDPEWYRQQYPDVVAAGKDPLVHYITIGAAEGRRPSARFDPSWYLARNRHVAAAGVEPLTHYLSTGSVDDSGLDEYADWIRLYDTVSDNDRIAIASAIEAMDSPPLISVVMPVYETPEIYLRAAIDSVCRQLYPHWELCIADDASTAPHVRRILEEYRATNSRIKVCYRSENGHIAVASNSAMALAEGSFVALLDHDDELREHALYMVAAALDADPEIDLIYSDEDRIDGEGRRYNPYFKSDWNPDLILSQNMFCHLGVYRRDLIGRIGGFRSGYDGSQDYDLVLRAQSSTTPDRIRHIPHILYHWRAIRGSVAFSAEEKPYALEGARKAVAHHLAAAGIDAEVLRSPHPAFHRVRYALPKAPPRVTIVVPTRDRVELLRICIEGLLHKTDYPDIEILIVDNQSQESDTQTYFDQVSRDSRIRVLRYDAPFNYSAINNFAVSQATGNLLCFLNNDVEVINRDWLTEMVSQALRSAIGAVGALLYYPDGRIQHGGVVVGSKGVAWHAHHGLQRGEYGYFGLAAVVRNVSAITAACLVTRRAVFEEIGGFDDRNLPVAYNDVDLCLKIRDAGYLIVWTPHAELYHHESATRGPDTDSDKLERFRGDVDYMLRRWKHVMDNDPYYNPNMRLANFKLAFPPRVIMCWKSGFSELPISSFKSDDARLITASGLFSSAWYRAQNPDVAAAGIDPLEHYLKDGSIEGRRPNSLFDPTWYREQYPDVAAAGIEPLVHYLLEGSSEGRCPCPLFNPMLYREQHPEIMTMGIEPLSHFLNISNFLGRRSLAPGRLADYPELQIPDFFELREMIPRGAIAVVLHLYYPDLWDELRTAIERIAQPFDLFVSLVKGVSDHMRNAIKTAFSCAYIFDFPENRGRDVAPFLALAETGVFFRYELVCKLHSKRSPFEPDGDGWRRSLIEGVLGSSHHVDQIVSGFRADPDLGMVVADGNIYSAPEHWSGNERLLAKLLPRVGIASDVGGRAFPGGSIFWIRPFLLRTLVGVGLNLGDFEPEPLPRNGALSHAVERLIGLVCEDAGMYFAEWGQLNKTVARPAAVRSAKVRVFAYYLPQFHPIPENDAWWGAGFTEWTNVTQAKPLFAGHRQPRLPSELGFCDLRLAETREAQAKLAGQYGVDGFCYYYYWFNGRRILERPLEEMLASDKPDFPFMICWANEPWTRKWDGLSDEVLLPQTYEANWIARFARDIAPVLRDRRYFRLDGKPMLLIYRIGHVPEAAAAMRELRTALRNEGILEVHLAAAWVQFRNDVELPDDPATLNLDAYFEFPPHQFPQHPFQPRPAHLAMADPNGLYDYNCGMTAALAKLDEPIVGQRHRSVMAGFDNTPRRGADATVFHGATPTNFRRWLRGTVVHERHQKGDRVVFINAWNEWAEGACLEPDRGYGRGWLEAVASATETHNQDIAKACRDDR